MEIRKFPSGRNLEFNFHKKVGQTANGTVIIVNHDDQRIDD